MSTAQSEAIVRIEQKLDLLLLYLGACDSDALQHFRNGAAPICPVCGKHTTVVANYMTEEFVRTCSCPIGPKIVTGISQLMNPPVSLVKKVEKTNEQDEVSNEEASGGSSL